MYFTIVVVVVMVGGTALVPAINYPHFEITLISQ
jgi:hypothetical protein